MSSSVAGTEISNRRSPLTAADGTSSEPGRKSPAAPDTGLSPPPLAVKSSSPSPARENGSHDAVGPSENGVGNDGQDESEAETVVLSDRGGSNGTKRESNGTIKHERLDGDKMSEIPSPRPSPKARSSPNGVRPTSETDPKDDASSNRKSIERRRKNGVLQESRSPSKAQSPSSARASSVEGEGSARAQSESAAPSRKRKSRDDHSLDKMEPPRQRQKSVASTRESNENSHRKQNNDSSLSRSHQRSVSTQSTANTSSSRKRRDGAPLTIEKRQWNSDSDSDTSSSPRPQAANRARERVQRSSHRSLASPLRTMAPRKNVDKFGATRLARECEKGDVDSVEEVYNMAPEELDQEDYAGNSPLQKAALHGHAEVVGFLISKKCRTDCESKTGDTPLIDAVENGHLDVIKLLLDKGKVNPHHQNHKGQRAVDVVNHEEDEAEDITRELKRAMRRENNDETSSRTSRQPQQSSSLLYNEYNTETLKDKAAEGDMAAVAELITANIKPNNACGVAAARGGHDEILSIFLGVGLKGDPDPAKHNETPMTVAIGRGHLKVIKMLLDQDGFDPTRRDRQGRSYWELSEERQGPRWQQERNMLKDRYDEHRRAKQQQQGGKAQRSPSVKKRQANASPGPNRGERTRVGRPTSPSTHQGARDTRDSSPMSPERKKRRRRTSSSASHPSSQPPAKKASSDSKIRSERDREKLKASTSRPSSKDSVSQREIMRRRRVVDDDDSSEEDNVRVSAAPSNTQAARKMKTAVRDEKRDETRRLSGTKIKKEERSTPDSARKSTPDVDKEREARRAEIRARKEERRAEEEKKKQAEEERRIAEEKRKAAERQAAEEEEKERRRAEAERKRKAEEEAEAERKRIALEKEKAEQEAAAAEAARLAKERKEAEEAEARKKAEEAAAAARKAERAQLISKLPTQLQLALDRPADRPLKGKVIGSRRRFGIDLIWMPVHTVSFSELHPTSPVWTESPGLTTASATADHDELLEAARIEGEKPEAERLWMLSHQAIGVLGISDFDAGLEGWPNIGEPKSEWTRLPVTQSQLSNWIQAYDAPSLAFEYNPSYEPRPSDPEDHAKELMNDWRKGQEAKTSLLNSWDKLRWVPYAEFLREVAKRPGLRGMEVYRTGVSHAVRFPSSK